MPILTNALKSIDPQEVMAQVVTNPKFQLGVGAVMTGGGSAAASGTVTPDFSVAMAYMGFVSMGMGIVLMALCVTHRGILVYKEMKGMK